MNDYENNPKLTPLLISYLQECGVESLTDVQLRALEANVPLGSSAIVCAPTSSGKTLIGELALANALSNGLDALYLVSHKALAEQKFRDFVARFSGPQWASTVTVGISTGEHEEGEVNCKLLISTYEKALGLMLAGRLRVSQTLVIADELQIIGELGRGPSVEILCALLRQRQPHQFVGLTATVENPEDLAAWMNCATVRSDKRDIDLFQTVLYSGQQYTVRLGEEDGTSYDSAFDETDLHKIIRKLLEDGLGPVLIFTESRREAADLANQFCEKSQRAANSVGITEQLQLFTEPTESSQQLMSHAERRVTFHTADLTPDERIVIEAGFIQASFDVCFATSTLAAGVNFPFRTVIFAKLTYEYGDRAGRMFSKSDFRNMSGRAGRLGYHENGHVILLPENDAELRHANELVSPSNDRVFSELLTMSVSRTVLSLVAAHAVSSKEELTTFFHNTFYWHQVLENNPKRLDEIVTRATTAIDWLLENNLVEESHLTILPTPLGKSASLSGLLPETANRFIELLRDYSEKMQADFNVYESALIHWAITCPEFTDEYPSRFLPWASGQMKPESSLFMQNVNHLTAWDRTNDQVTRAVHALSLFIQGEAERKIRFATGISAGNLHRLAMDVAWILEGLSCISGASDLGCPQSLTNYLSLLARRVRWGTPIEALDVLRIATRRNVPGFGRQRVMALIVNGFTTVMDVITAKKDQLARLLSSQKRADALIAALSDSFDGGSTNFERMHLRLGDELGIREKVLKCYQSIGIEYDDAIYELLREESSWSVNKLDDGKRKNVPDVELELGSTGLLMECKTVTKSPPVISKEESFAVLQKSADFPPEMKRISLGKPDFDEHSKKKAAASSQITLVKHELFMEGLMRVLTGRLTPADFVKWIAEPGVSEINRLPGTPTYAEPS